MNLMTSHAPAFPSPTVFFLNAISFKMNLQLQAYIPLKSVAEREKRSNNSVLAHVSHRETAAAHFLYRQMML